MADAQFEPFFDWIISLDGEKDDDEKDDGEKDEKMLSAFVSDYNQKEACRESFLQDHPSIKSQTERIELHKSSHIQSIQSNQCCAFRKLDEMLGNVVENEGPCKRLVLWVAICRDKDPCLDNYVKRSCPLSKCTFSCDPENGDLMRHMLGCSFRKYGTYRCPYCKNSEEFTVPYQRRPRKPWIRSKSLRDAFHNICELGSKGIHRAFCHSNKRQRYDSLDDHSTDNESTTSEIKASPQTVYDRSTNDLVTWSEKPPIPMQRSQALQSRVQSQIREIYVPNMVSELESNNTIYWELPVVEISGVQENVLKIDTTFKNSDTDTLSLTPLSSYISSERFGSPISPEEYQPLVEWMEAMKSSSGKQASLGTMRFEWPENQKQTMQATPTLSTSRAANERRRARGAQSLCVDTSCARSRSVTPSKSDSPTCLSEQSLSTPDDPEVLRDEPITAFHQLRKTFYETYRITYAQLSVAPRLPINQEIINMKTNPADVFLCGWAVVKDVLNGQLPQNFWSLFSLAHLAFTCGQVVWEGKLKYQIDDIVDELKTWWSHALYDLHQRHCYQEVIEQIFVKRDRNSMDTRMALSLDSPGLQARLRDGVVIRLCLQFLSTYEFLQYRVERSKKLPMNSPASLLQAAHMYDNNTSNLYSVVIQPLLATNQFHALERVIEKGGNLLRQYPSTTSRELEIFLVCHARYYTGDHTLHLEFRQAVADACSKAGLYEPVRYLLNDIAVILQCQKDLESFQGTTQSELQPSHANIAELYGSSVGGLLSYSTHTTQDRSSYEYPLRLGGGHGCSPIHTPTSANTASPSTAASSIFTPISGHSTSPTTANETNFPYTSMDWQANIPKETNCVNSNFQWPADNKNYPLITDGANSINMVSPDITSPNSAQFFMPGIPTKAGLSVDPEAKASRPCPKCGQIFTSKEKHLSSNIQRHIREQHSSASGITCPHCKREFKRKHNLKVHMNNTVKCQKKTISSSTSQNRSSVYSQDRNSVYSQGW